MNQSDLGWGNTTIGILSGVLGSLVLALLTADKTFDHIPLPLRLLLVVALVLGMVAGGHYYIVLGGPGDPPSPAKEKRYHALRMKLAKAGGPTDVYATSLTTALGVVDVFFRDKGHNDKSWLARRLGLEGSGPRWTAKAFDR